VGNFESVFVGKSVMVTVFGFFKLLPLVIWELYVPLTQSFNVQAEIFGQNFIRDVNRI
jgi:hypothetical protein